MTENFATFADLPSASSGAFEGRAAIVIGADHGSPYKPGVASHAAGGPQAIRRGSKLFAHQLTQVDFDLGHAIFKDKTEGRLADAGDLKLTLDDGATNREIIARAVRDILDAGAVPVVLGGDDSVPIPAFSAYKGRGPLTMIQIDAHVDWGDVLQGEPLGYGSPMRRASEMPWIREMRQIGIRGLGSGTADQHEDARRWGSKIFTMDDVERDGVEAALEGLAPHGDCFLSLDLDGLDPSVMPAVNMPTAGGLIYRQVLKLIRALGKRRRIAGAAIVEFTPARDPHGFAAETAARIVLDVLGVIAEQSGV